MIPDPGKWQTTVSVERKGEFGWPPTSTIDKSPKNNRHSCLKTTAWPAVHVQRRDYMQEVDKPGLDSLKTGRWIGGNHPGLPNRTISAISVRFDLPILRLRYSATSKAAVTATRRFHWTRPWISSSSGNAGKRESGGRYLYQRDFQEYTGAVIIARKWMVWTTSTLPCQRVSSGNRNADWLTMTNRFPVSFLGKAVA